MRRISEDLLQRTITYELANGRHVKFDARAVAEFGIDALLKSIGEKAPSGRLDVFQDGERIGTVPASFEPLAIKSTSFFYQVRQGDFTRDGDKWIADKMLGPGDLEAVPGFVWDRR